MIDYAIERGLIDQIATSTKSKPVRLAIKKMIWVFVLLTIVFLILTNSFFVAAEFSAVSSRRPRLAQLAEQGNRAARILLPIAKDPLRLDTYIAACQLGITASSLVLGYYGQSELSPFIEPLLIRFGRLSTAAAASITTTGILIFLTTLQVIFGELVPKSIGVQYPERLGLATALPMRWLMILLRPLIWLFNGSGHFILSLLGKGIETEHIHLHQPQELMILFEESTAGGLLDSEERKLLSNSLQLRQLAVRQVMIPRNRMLAAPADQPCNELLALLADSPYSRLPLYEESVDNVVGIVHLKDLLCLRLQTGEHDARKAMRPVLFVPANMPVDEVFAQLQRKRYHVAIVLDEYGGTEGMVTLEDLIEEIFGEIQDEFDIDIVPPIKILSGDTLQVRGDTLIEDLNQQLNLYLPSEDVDTIGGLILNVLGHVPQVNEEVEMKEINLIVDKMVGKGVALVKIKVSPEQMKHIREIMQ